MNKEHFTQTLQVALFSFEGASEQEILELNHYNPEIIKIGIAVCSNLKQKEIENEL